MNANEYHQTIKRFGEKLLSKSGFEYRRNNWHNIDGARQVSLISANSPFGTGFLIKYLTVVLVDLDIRSLSEGYPKKYENFDSFCPIQISPLLLKGFKESGAKVKKTNASSI